MLRYSVWICKYTCRCVCLHRTIINANMAPNGNQFKKATMNSNLLCNVHFRSLMHCHWSFQIAQFTAQNTTKCMQRRQNVQFRKKITTVLWLFVTLARDQWLDWIKLCTHRHNSRKHNLLTLPTMAISMISTNIMQVPPMFREPKSQHCITLLCYLFTSCYRERLVHILCNECTAWMHWHSQHCRVYRE